jgi:hypothetical protein
MAVRRDLARRRGMLGRASERRNGERAGVGIGLTTIAWASDSCGIERGAPD